MNIKHCLYYVFNYFGKCGIIKIFIYILIYMTKKVPKKEINKLTVSEKVTYIWYITKLQNDFRESNVWSNTT